MRSSVFAIAVAVAFIAGVYATPMIPPGALAQRRPAQVSVPRAWGKLAGMFSTIMLFEASDGTIRFVHMEDGSLEGTITRN